MMLDLWLVRVTRSCISVFFFKQKTAYEMRISDWSSDVCSSDLAGAAGFQRRALVDRRLDQTLDLVELRLVDDGADMAALGHRVAHLRAVEHRLDDADRLALAVLVEDRKSTRLNSSH